MSNITALKNWSTTEADNQPDTTDAFTIAGDLRAIQVAMRNELATQDTIASATTTDLGSKDAGSLTISGTTTITGLGTVSAGISKRVVFSGALTLTHNATSLILPSAANITTAANDRAEFESLGSGNWRCNYYVKADGRAIVAESSSRNVVTNGGMMIHQRGIAAQANGDTFTAGAAVAYCADTFFGWCTGANVSGIRDTSNVSTRFPTANASAMYQFQGAASVTAIGFGTRISASDAAPLGGGNATLSVWLANTQLTSVGYAVYSANAVDDFSATTLITSGTFTVSSTGARYSATFALTAGQADTGIEVRFTVGAQITGQWEITNVQLEPGSVASPFKQKTYAEELAACQRTYEKSFGCSSSSASINNIAPVQNAGAGTGEAIFMAGKAGALADFGDIRFKVTKRTRTPTITLYNPAAANGQVRDITAAADCSAAGTANISDNGFRVTCTGNASTAVGNILGVHWTAACPL